MFGLCLRLFRFREEIIARRSKFDLSKARDRAHILVGLATAVANIDEIIKIIRGSKTLKMHAIIYFQKLGMLNQWVLLLN